MCGMDFKPTARIDWLSQVMTNVPDVLLGMVFFHCAEEPRR